MVDCSLELARQASFLDMAIAFGLFRSGGNTVESAADKSGHYFRMRVEPADLQLTFTRLIEQEHIAADHRAPFRYVITLSGQAAFECVFFGFMRLVDGGQNRFSLAALWQLATANLDAIVDPETRECLVEPDALFGRKGRRH